MEIVSTHTFRTLSRLIEWHSSRFTFNYSKLFAILFVVAAADVSIPNEKRFDGDIISRLIHPEINFRTLRAIIKPDPLKCTSNQIEVDGLSCKVYYY